LAITYYDEDKRDLFGLYNLLFDNCDEFFVPVLGTAYERLEMIILHTIETSNTVTFGKLTLRNLFLIIEQELCPVVLKINIQMSI